MFIFLRNGERVEVPEATSGTIAQGRFLCLDSAGRVVRRFPLEDVVMFSSEPWDSALEVISDDEEDGEPGGGIP
jgi:hypothetical protein